MELARSSPTWCANSNQLQNEAHSSYESNLRIWPTLYPFGTKRLILSTHSLYESKQRIWPTIYPLETKRLIPSTHNYPRNPNKESGPPFRIQEINLKHTHSFYESNLSFWPTFWIERLNHNLNTYIQPKTNMAYTLKTERLIQNLNTYIHPKRYLAYPLPSPNQMTNTKHI